MPVTLSQPQHLAALATLFGLDPPDVERASVLELGCASAGNIIPLAARFPRASFRGIDLSQRHIDDGRKRIAELALENIGLQQGDLTTLELAEQRFDYVICHGVFSWVPKAAQDAIFRICRQTLAPNGMVAISYNVLPGWHLRMVIRDLCRHYAGAEGSPQRRVARARAALRQIAEASSETEPYGQLLRLEARRLKDVPSAYIMGEFLTRDNAPCHVGDFIKRAADEELDYLCEADLSAAVPPTLDPAIRDRIASIAATDRPAAEQHIDFLTGRLFRSSILVRRQSASRLPPAPDPDRLHSLHVASPLRFDPALSKDQLTVFTDLQARPITTGEPAIQRALARLAAAYPMTLSMDELAADSETESLVEDGARVRRAVLTIVLAGRATVSVLPLRVGRAAEQRPRVWSVARAEAASAQPWVTTLRHGAVPANPVLRILLPHLDGTNDRGALRALLVDALRGGALRVPELPADPSPGRLAELAEEYVEQALHHLERNALLEADAGHAKNSPREL